MIYQGVYVDDADVAKARRQSVRRWFLDREGTLWINVRSMRRKPLSLAEWAAIDEAVDAFVARGGQPEPVH